jgi:hypothetical protein
MLTRRQALLSTLFGGGMIGLRALATGLPASFLLNPRRALADLPPSGCADPSKAQFIIFNTSGQGDPINASVPGTYDDPNVVHSLDPSMAPTALAINGQTYTAAAPWAALPQTVLDRTCFWHTMTNTPVHPKEPDVLKLMGSTLAGEMLPSLLAKQLAPCLGTIQSEPLCIGATTPAEGLSFGGAALPIIPALALKSTLTNPAGPLTDLQPLRDQTLNQLYDLYKNGATSAQRAYIDSLVSSQAQIRNLNQDLLNALSTIKDNGAASQVLAAVTLIQMKVAPVISIHIPFGGDNHRDPGLATETAETVSGVQTIATLMQALDSAGLADRVLFATLNVFGRTLGPGNADGRQHNENHQVSLTIGKSIRGGVVGGLTPVAKDYGATGIDSKTGAASSTGDISSIDTLASYGRTLLAAVGVESSVIETQITSGSVVTGVLG